VRNPQTPQQKANNSNISSRYARARESYLLLAKRSWDLYLCIYFSDVSKATPKDGLTQDSEVVRTVLPAGARMCLNKSLAVHAQSRFKNEPLRWILPCRGWSGHKFAGILQYVPLTNKYFYAEVNYGAMWQEGMRKPSVTFWRLKQGEVFFEPKTDLAGNKSETQGESITSDAVALFLSMALWKRFPGSSDYKQGMSWTAWQLKPDMSDLQNQNQHWDAKVIQQVVDDEDGAEFVSSMSAFTSQIQRLGNCTFFNMRKAISAALLLELWDGGLTASAANQEVKQMQNVLKWHSLETVRREFAPDAGTESRLASEPLLLSYASALGGARDVTQMFKRQRHSSAPNTQFLERFRFLWRMEKYVNRSTNGKSTK
jgi:hypothetical protein